MADKFFESLSHKIIHQIFAFVHFTHPSSLQALALVNKHCNALCKPFLFSTLTWHVLSEGEVDQLVQTVPEIVAQHVRHLIIESVLPNEANSIHPSQPQDSFHSTASKNWNFLERSGHGGPYQKRFAVGSKWNSLATLISNMPKLKHFIYNYTCQLAPLILKAVEEHQPPVQLHMDNFYLRTLCGFERFYPRLDLANHEWDLATSTCLTSISAAVRHFGNGPDYTRNGIRDLMFGLAPNLESLRLFDAMIYGEIREDMYKRREWESFDLTMEQEQERTQTRQRRKLTRLALCNSQFHPRSGGME
jgi:hypothetical protein